jgi:hypothetical protein
MVRLYFHTKFHSPRAKENICTAPRCFIFYKKTVYRVLCLFRSFINSRHFRTLICFILTLRLKRDGTRAETRFRLSPKRGASVQSTTGSRGVRINGSNAGYPIFRFSVKGTGYPLHSPVSPSLPRPYVTVCHHVSTGLYLTRSLMRHFLTLMIKELNIRGWFGFVSSGIIFV